MLDASKNEFLSSNAEKPEEPIPKKKMMFKYKMNSKGNMNMDFG